MLDNFLFASTLVFNSILPLLIQLNLANNADICCMNFLRFLSFPQHMRVPAHTGCDHAKPGKAA